jgi:hypothetical protein
VYLPMGRARRGMGCDFADPTCSPGAPVVNVGPVISDPAQILLAGTSAGSPVVLPAGASPSDPVQELEAMLAPIGGVAGSVGWVVGAAAIALGLLVLALVD